MGKLSQRIDALEERIEELEDELPTVGPFNTGGPVDHPDDTAEEALEKQRLRVQRAKDKIAANPGVDDLGHGSLKGNLAMQEMLLRKMEAGNPPKPDDWFSHSTQERIFWQSYFRWPSATYLKRINNALARAREEEFAEL
jgi:hypothetical protein